MQQIISLITLERITYSLKSPKAFEMMFYKKVKRKEGHIILRDIQKENETTCIQAEVCVFGKIEKNTLNLVDLQEKVK